MSRNRILTFGIAGFCALWLVCLFVMVPRIEADISDRATQRLDISSLPLNVIDVQGRDIVVAGVVDTEGRRDSIIQALNEIEGVRSIENGLEIAHRAVARREPAVAKSNSRIVIRFTGNATVLHGVVSSEQQRVAMIDIARKFGPDGLVYDRLKVVEGIADLPSSAVLGLIARVLSTVEKGALRVDSAGITIEGFVVDESARIAIGRLARTAAPGVNVVNALTVLGVDDQDDAIQGDFIDVRIEGQIHVDSGSIGVGMQNAIGEILKESAVDFVGDTATLTALSQRLLNQIAGLLLVAPDFPAKCKALDLGRDKAIPIVVLAETWEDRH